MARRGDRQQLAAALCRRRARAPASRRAARASRRPAARRARRRAGAARPRRRRRARASGRSANGRGPRRRRAPVFRLPRHARQPSTPVVRWRSGNELVEQLPWPASPSRRRSASSSICSRRPRRTRATSRALLVDLLADWPESRERLRDIRELEHEGDRLTHEVINLLNRTFVTPLDRDDMYRLASAIDDVCDHIDEAADNIDAVRGARRAGAGAGAGRGDPSRRVAAARGGRAARGLHSDSQRQLRRAARARGRGRPALARGDRRSLPLRRRTR